MARFVSITATPICVVLILKLIRDLMMCLREVSNLIEPIDLTESAKVFTFACALLGVSSVMLDFIPNNGVFLIPPGIAFVVSAFLFLKEMYVKYIKALKSI